MPRELRRRDPPAAVLSGTPEPQAHRPRFLLRRLAFPAEPPPEWFVVDLLQHHAMAGAALGELRAGLVATLRQGRWDRARLREMARGYGRKATVAVVDGAIEEAGGGRGDGARSAV